MWKTHGFSPSTRRSFPAEHGGKPIYTWWDLEASWRILKTPPGPTSKPQALKLGGSKPSQVIYGGFQVGKYRTIIYKTFAHCQITRGYSHDIAILSLFCHILRSYIMLIYPNFAMVNSHFSLPGSRPLRHLSTAVTTPQGFFDDLQQWAVFYMGFSH